MTDAFLPGSDLLDAATALDAETVELRRAIHAEPELGLQLPLTQKKITEALTGLGLDIKLGESTTSVVADLDTGKPGPTVLLRGDMDALPLQEDYVSPFQSKHDGKMHACGHDSHVAMLASAAKLLADNRDELTGKVRFMFQPGEEGFHGARYMIDEGVLDGVDRAFAIHVSSNAPTGILATRKGPLLASADRFELTMKGKGGHASAPQHCIDPIPAAAAAITGLHTMVGRVVDPARNGLITVAHVDGGTTNNIIPESVFMEGTIRSHDEETRENIKAGLVRVVDGVAAAHGCTCSTEITPGYPVTVNHDEDVELSGRVARSVIGDDAFYTMPLPILAAEDFSYVLNEVPGAMVMLGAAPEDIDDLADAAPNHSNYMRIGESAMRRGVAMYAGMALAR